MAGDLNRSTQHFILEGKDGVCRMERRFHRGYSPAEKAELWDRWKRGESLKAIGRAFGKQSSSIYFLVAPHGGFRPAERRRSRLGLTLAEREAISRGVTEAKSPRCHTSSPGATTSFQRSIMHLSISSMEANGRDDRPMMFSWPK
jgi:hypothetical protein